VQDLEHKAALVHFSSEQAAEMSKHRSSWVAVSDQQLNPRVTHVHSLAKPPSCKYLRITVVYTDVFSSLRCLGSSISVLFLRVLTL